MVLIRRSFRRTRKGDATPCRSSACESAARVSSAPATMWVLGRDGRLERNIVLTSGEPTEGNCAFSNIILQEFVVDQSRK